MNGIETFKYRMREQGFEEYEPSKWRKRRVEMGSEELRFTLTRAFMDWLSERLRTFENSGHLRRDITLVVSAELAKSMVEVYQPSIEQRFITTFQSVTVNISPDLSGFACKFLVTRKVTEVEYCGLK